MSEYAMTRLTTEEKDGVFYATLDHGAADELIAFLGDPSARREDPASCADYPTAVDLEGRIEAFFTKNGRDAKLVLRVENPETYPSIKYFKEYEEQTK